MGGDIQQDLEDELEDLEDELAELRSEVGAVRDEMRAEHEEIGDFPPLKDWIARLDKALSARDHDQQIP